MTRFGLDFTLGTTGHLIAVNALRVVVWAGLLAIIVLVVRKRGRRLVRPRPLGVFSVLFAIGAAIVMWIRLDFHLFQDEKLLAGTNIHAAIILVTVASVLGLLSMFVVPYRRIPWVFLVEAALLGIALVLVGVDSATYTERLTGGLLDDSTTITTYHVWLLYPLWGAPLLVLLVQARRAWNEAYRPDARKTLKPSSTSNVEGTR